MSEIRFEVPFCKEDLFNPSSTSGYLVEDTYSCEDIYNKLKEFEYTLEEQGSSCIVSYFDIFFNTINDLKQIERNVQIYAIDCLIKIFDTNTRTVKLAQDSNENLNCHQVNLKMLIYLLCQFVIEFEINCYHKNVLYVKTPGKKSKKKGTVDACRQNDTNSLSESIWNQKRTELLESFLHLVSQVEIEKVWSPPIADPKTIELVASMSYKLLESPITAKHKETQNFIIQLLGLCISRFKLDINGFSMKIITMIQNHEHLSTILPSILNDIFIRYDAQNVFGTLMKDLETLSNSQQELFMGGGGGNTGVGKDVGSSPFRSLSTFLIQMCNINYRLYLPYMSLLVRYLDGNSYSLRIGALTIMGNIIIHDNIDIQQIEQNAIEMNDDDCEISENDDLKSKETKTLDNNENDAAKIDNKSNATIDQYFTYLLDHTHDVNAFVRSKAFQILSTILTGNIGADQDPIVELPEQSNTNDDTVVGSRNNNPKNGCSAIPKKWLPIFIARARLQLNDKSSNVRKNALQFLTRTLSTNALIGTSPALLMAQCKILEENIGKNLNSSLALMDKQVQNVDAINDRGKDDDCSTQNGIHNNESDCNQNSGEKVSNQDTESSDKIVNKPKPNFNPKNAEEVLEQLKLFMNELMSSNAMDESLNKTIDNINSTHISELDPKTREVINELSKLAKLIRRDLKNYDTLKFYSEHANIIWREVYPTVLDAMLFSRSLTDCNEAVNFFFTAYQYGVGGTDTNLATYGIIQCLKHLISTPTSSTAGAINTDALSNAGFSGVRNRIVNAFANIFFLNETNNDDRYQNKPSNTDTDNMDENNIIEDNDEDSDEHTLIEENDNNYKKSQRTKNVKEKKIPKKPTAIQTKRKPDMGNIQNAKAVLEKLLNFLTKLDANGVVCFEDLIKEFIRLELFSEDFPNILIQKIKHTTKFLRKNALNLQTITLDDNDKPMMDTNQSIPNQELHLAQEKANIIKQMKNQIYLGCQLLIALLELSRMLEVGSTNLDNSLCWNNMEIYIKAATLDSCNLPLPLQNQTNHNPSLATKENNVQKDNSHNINKEQCVNHLEILDQTTLKRYKILATILAKLRKEYKVGEGRITQTALRLPSNHIIFQQLIPMIIKKFDAKHDWSPACQSIIQVIYLLHETPELMCASLIADIKAKYFTSSPPDPVSNNQESIVTPERLAKLLFCVGEIALNHLTYLYDSLLPYLKAKRLNEQTTVQGKVKTNPKTNGTPIRINVNEDTDDEEELCLATGPIGETDDSDHIEFARIVCEKELFENEKSLLKPFLRLIEQIVKSPVKFPDPKMRNASINALVKFMIVSSKLCEQYMPLIVTILSSNTPSLNQTMNNINNKNVSTANTLINNSENTLTSTNNNNNLESKITILVGIGDLIVRFPTLVEPWIPYLYQRLSDSNAYIRMVTLKIVSHLISRDMIIAKEQLCEVAKRIIDPDEAIKHIARQFFENLSLKGNSIYNALPDIVGKLSLKPINGNNSDSSEQLKHNGNDKIAIDDLEQFNTIAKFLCGYIQKDKQVEGIIEKMCQRISSTYSSTQAIKLLKCIAFLPHSDRSLKKLMEELPNYQSKLAIPEFYDCLFSEIIDQCKTEKSEIKASVDEFRQKIAEIDQHLGDMEMLSEQAKRVLSVSKKKPASKIKETEKSLQNGPSLGTKDVLLNIDWAPKEKILEMRTPLNVRSSGKKRLDTKPTPLHRHSRTALKYNDVDDNDMTDQQNHTPTNPFKSKNLSLNGIKETRDKSRLENRYGDIHNDNNISETELPSNGDVVSSLNSNQHGKDMRNITSEMNRVELIEHNETLLDNNIVTLTTTPLKTITNIKNNNNNKVSAKKQLISTKNYLISPAIGSDAKRKKRHTNTVLYSDDDDKNG